MADTPPPIESAGVNACLNDAGVREALTHHRDEETIVRNAISDYGIKFDDGEWAKVYKEIKNINWNDLNQLEIALGRDKRMG